MIDILMICPRCDGEITVLMDRAVLRVDVEPRARGELLYRCPACGHPSVSPIGGDLLAQLLLVGVRPVALAEPRLDRDDLAPAGAPFTIEDMLSWHEQLDAVDTVAPWE
ncbi:hypothetical protein SAMN04487968_11113 [Nocardioides terrae]|uniref:CpXC domain-containing protein n=1 Tax=Nocardioides terrae TaxID=574651 RepID=A0A1I1LTX5_9ACTN|nr:hypothetical protein [Nocardioides terrae]SFC76445.1 hypothetical protein SAMN04487968_11113 [Nocardioides terrae]